ncbi:MAG: hypothetical protein GY820_34330, partial [Gammaproteobacteria bacterium]|nr:hypothetical protein [Gammaproteobacteria bacterium]
MLPEDELEVWEDSNREIYTPPRVEGMDPKDVSLYESQWWVERKDRAVDEGTKTTRQFYNTFQKSIYLIGRVPACAALLMHRCQEGKGDRYQLTQEEMAKVMLVKAAAGHQPKQDLASPASGTVKTRKKSKQERDELKEQRKQKKAVAFKAKVDIKVMTPDQSSAAEKSDSGTTPMDYTCTSGTSMGES